MRHCRSEADGEDTSGHRRANAAWQARDESGGGFLVWAVVNSLSKLIASLFLSRFFLFLCASCCIVLILVRTPGHDILPVWAEPRYLVNGVFSGRGSN